MKSRWNRPQAGTVGELRLFRRELEGVDVGGVVAGIDVAQPLEALHEQRRADEQHQRQRRLPDDEHIASRDGGGRCCRGSRREDD